MFQPEVPHVLHVPVHALLGDAGADAEVADDVDEVLRGAVARLLDLLQGRLEYAIRHLVSFLMNKGKLIEIILDDVRCVLKHL